jgi:hypothetical protein
MRAHSVNRANVAGKVGVTPERVRQLMSEPTAPPFKMVEKFMRLIGFDAQEAMAIAKDTLLYKLPTDSQHAVACDAPPAGDSQYELQLAERITHLQSVITDMGKDLYELKNLLGDAGCRDAGRAGQGDHAARKLHRRQRSGKRPADRQ